MANTIDKAKIARNLQKNIHKMYSQIHKEIETIKEIKNYLKVMKE